VARDHLEQRRLAGAVLAHDAPALAAFDLEVEVLVDRLRPVALADAGELDDVVAGARRPLERERHDLAFARRSTRSILSIFFCRLCAAAAFATCVPKRSMKRCIFAIIASWRANVASCCAKRFFCSRSMKS
jgi:hypothetical protein